MLIKQIDQYLKTLLNVDKIKDAAINGLQIGDEEQNISKIAVAVDANLATVEKAAALKAGMLLVHHGIYWGSVFPLVKADYRKVKILTGSSMALYAQHLPLDMHEKYGNNAVISNRLKLKSIVPFGLYHGTAIGFQGENSSGLDGLVALCRTLSPEPKTIIHKPERNTKIAVVSGKGGFDILNDFIASGCDILVTGEIEHSLYNTISDYQLNVIALGHYESEKFGVIELAGHLKEKFGLETEFIYCPTGF